MLKLICVVLVIVEVFCDNCTVPVLTTIVYKKVDSEPEKVNASDKIQIEDDAFHLLIANESLPKLCHSSVDITNELSILQIRNSNLLNIEPGAFNIIPTLTLLKISYNPLTTLKKGVFNTIHVKEIDISNNYISVIEDETFNNISNLEIVRLSYNAIKHLNSNWFRNSPNVYKLSIIYNELTTIPSKAFQNMNKHKPLKLRLSANRIFEFDENAFEGCGDIEVLRLNGNKLNDLPETLFINRTIKHLEVNTNKLLCFPDVLLESSLRSLAFVENPSFNCNCLRKVRTFVEKNKVDVCYPAIICEDKQREVNIVFNLNKTYEIPILLPSTETTYR